MPITFSKAIEILDLNLKDAGKHMPPDCQLAILLGLDSMAAFQQERDEHGYLRFGILPHEAHPNQKLPL